MRAMQRAIPLMIVAASTSACEPSAPPTYTARDSVGIRIVESTAPSWAPGEEWTVSTEPTLHIGVVDGGAEEYRFTAIAGLAQHGGTWRQGDGTIVAADFGSRQIRRYGSDGTFLNAWGRRGDGPGEFQNLGVFPYRGDSIVAVDITRYSFYDSEGNAGRTLSLPQLREMDPARERPIPIASTGFLLAFQDGAFLAVRSPTPIVTFGECQSSNRIFFRYAPDGQFADTIGVFDAPANCWAERGSGLLTLPFPHEFVFTADGENVYVGGIVGFEVRHISLDSRSQTLVRASHVDLRTTDAIRTGFGDNAVEVARANNMDIPSVRRALADLEYPETVPAFSQLLTDPEGHLWVRHYKQRWTVGPETWSVFAPEGFLLGVVDTPERLQVRQIGSDFIFGIWTDELDIRYVREYALLRN
jgi:hypothetical protein